MSHREGLVPVHWLQAGQKLAATAQRCSPATLAVCVGGNWSPRKALAVTKKVLASIKASISFAVNVENQRRRTITGCLGQQEGWAATSSAGAYWLVSAAGWAGVRVNWGVSKAKDNADSRGE